MCLLKKWKNNLFLHFFKEQAVLKIFYCILNKTEDTLNEGYLKRANNLSQSISPDPKVKTAKKNL